MTSQPNRPFPRWSVTAHAVFCKKLHVEGRGGRGRTEGSKRKARTIWGGSGAARGATSWPAGLCLSPGGLSWRGGVGGGSPGGVDESERPGARGAQGRGPTADDGTT